MDKFINEFKKDLVVKIIGLMKSKKFTWHDGFTNKQYNYYTNKPFTGINRLILGSTDFKDSRWLTLKQANYLKLKIKKGSKSTKLIHYNSFYKIISEEEYSKLSNYDKEHNVIIENNQIKHKKPFLKCFNVFNVEQIESFELLPSVDEKKYNHQQLTNKLANNTKVLIVHKNVNCPYYNLENDTIYIPFKENYISENMYISTLVHELAHSSGTKERLNRLKEPFERAKEELIACLTEIFFCQDYKIDSIIDENHLAYLQSWIKVLEDDYNFLFKAASSAEQALNWIKNSILNEEHSLLDSQVDNVDNEKVNL